jgi:hypothetical protein
MENEFLRKQLRICTYQLKQGTKSSYYFSGGERLLPNRVGITSDGFTQVRKKGRNLQPIAGQFVATFNKKEESILKQYPPYTIRTQIWKIEDYPQLIGYGTCGISNENGETQDTGDLMVFHSNNKWETITVFYFMGLAKPEFRDEAFRYVASIV